MKAAPPKTSRKCLAVYGDAQAAAIAAALQRVSALTERYDILYANSASAAASPALMNCSVLLEQRGDAPALKASARALHVRFPALDFKILWPFNRPNEHNHPEPPEFPFGRFPYGDTFISSCVKRNIPSETIVQLYLGRNWTAGTWPDLDLLFRQESSRLTARDAQCDVRIGSYALKHFRKKRLFVAPTSPADALLVELVSRLLAAAFPKNPELAGTDVASVFAAFGARDMLGILAVPIHPRVAEHFGLEWYDRNDTYNYLDRAQLRDVEYYRELIAASGDAAKP